MKKILFLLLPAAMLLVSCHSSKKGVKDNDKKTTTTTIITNSNTNANTGTTVSKKDDKKPQAVEEKNFTAKVKVNITRGDKNISTTGNLRMRRDDVIQLTLVDPLIGIAEVGRIELSPDNVLVIDRINKRYVQTTYDEFGVLKEKNINFETIQSFFWDEAQKSGQLVYTIPSRVPLKLDLKLSDKNNASNWEGHTSVSGKYVKTDADKLFGSLMP
ncbi:MAG: DUF4292 domain-containing protein [Prevotellaceae bacterium]|nr:DUF4292 domain-containing protein [Candidatus Minthosoma caballi]